MTEHTGLGHTAVEGIQVGPAEQQQVQRAGGVLVEGYNAARYLEELALVYAHPAAIAPSGVRGSFHRTVTVYGLAVWLPDEWTQTLLLIAAEHPERRLIDLTELTDAVLATPTP